VIAFKIVEPMIGKYFPSERSSRSETNVLWYALPLFVVLIPLYYFFLSKYPLLHGHFDPSALDLLTPLSSPLLSILSLHQVIGRVGQNVSGLSLNLMYFILLVVFVSLGYLILRSERISPLYKNFVVMLYLSICAFFVCSYLFNRIDQSPRHFKFLGYIFLPGLLTVAGTYLRKIQLQIIVGLICLVSIAALIYLKRDWTEGRIVSRNYFYRNYDNKYDVDRLDKESYQKLLLIAKDAPRSAIFFVQASIDIEMDIPFRCIIPWHNLDQKYFDHGPVIFACLLQDTLRKYPNLLTEKFPDYRSFKLLDQTKTFVFYKCE